MRNGWVAFSMTQYFTSKCKVMAEEMTFVNAGGWPALLPRAKVTCSSGAPAGHAGRASPGLPFGLRCRGQAAALQESGGARGKLVPKPLGGAGRREPRAARGSRCQTALSVPALRGRAEEEEEGATEEAGRPRGGAGCGAAWAGPPFGASLREHSRVGQRLFFPLYFTFYLPPSPARDPSPRPRAPGRPLAPPGASRAASAGRAAFCPGCLCPPAGRERARTSVTVSSRRGRAGTLGRSPGRGTGTAWTSAAAAPGRASASAVGEPRSPPLQLTHTGSCLQGLGLGRGPLPLPGTWGFFIL